MFEIVKLHLPHSQDSIYFQQGVEYIGNLLQAYYHALEIFNVTQDTAQLNAVLQNMARQIGCETCDLHGNRDVVVGPVKTSYPGSQMHVVMEGHCSGVEGFRPQAHPTPEEATPHATFRGFIDEGKSISAKVQRKTGYCGLNPIRDYSRMRGQG